MRVTVIIPALNEEGTIGEVVRSIPPLEGLEVIVVDNGSSDATGHIASEAGARVIRVEERGYGAACLGGIAAAANPDVIVFLDGDLSDDPGDLPSLLNPVEEGRCDLVIGSRVLGNPEPGSLTPQQRFGNALATFLIRLLYGVRYTDLGPFRVVTRKALEAMKMEDRSYGWTVEMQVKAARLGLRATEVPVRYRRRRAGVSKVSGNLKGSILAGWFILTTIFRHARSRPE